MGNALIIFFLSVTCFFSCASSKLSDPKINGVSYVASRDAIDSINVQPVVDVQANYAAIMPFGFIRDFTNPNIVHNTDRQWFGETKVGVRQYIEELRNKNINIMIKPQLWIWHGEFTGHLNMSTERNWAAFETSYKNFLLEYAEIAEETSTEILCIGTELENFVSKRPQFWNKLIEDIKKVYSGKLTYAANWDEYKRTPFWDQLDYIGIDAYFPVSNSKTPTVEECIKGWENHKPTIKAIANQYNKPILFTEFGYRSLDFAAKEPWVSDHTLTNVNLAAQSNATEALFITFWEEDWFAGGFVWKWFHKHTEVGGINDSQFTPQNKPVEDVIKSFYSLKLN